MLANAKAVFGVDSSNYQWIQTMHGKLVVAASEGHPWVSQPPNPEVSSSTDDTEGIRARLVLVTDSWCASACLDFADEVLSVPGTVRLGLPTGADSVHLDVGTKILPSGVKLSVPLKVWRNRARGKQPTLRAITSF